MSQKLEFLGNWYVLYVKNKQERLVREELPYETIVPLIEEKKTKLNRTTDQRVTIVDMVPKYPNYVFVKHDGSAGFFDKCLLHKCVVSFAGGIFNEAKGEYPEALTNKEVEDIFTSELSRNLEEDTYVSVVDGPYKSQHGKILSKKNGRCLVEISLFKDSPLKLEEWIPEEFLIDERISS